MSDAREQPFADGVSASVVATETDGPSRGRRFRPSASMWRLRASLPPNVVHSLKAKFLPRIFPGKTPALTAVPDDGVAAGDSIDTFAALTLSDDENAASDFVDRLLAQGVTIEAVFLQWLTPAARRLGAQWESDETAFAYVTLGVNRLHRIMRRLSDGFCAEPLSAQSSGSVLLTVIPGEQHSFGLSMVAEFFRKAGWNLCTGPFASHSELTTLVRHRWFDIVGFSVSSERRLDELKRDIESIRKGSQNKRVGIVIGGPMVLAHPELTATLGADMMSADAAEAPQQARGLMGRMRAVD